MRVPTRKRSVRTIITKTIKEIIKTTKKEEREETKKYDIDKNKTQSPVVLQFDLVLGLYDTQDSNTKSYKYNKQRKAGLILYGRKNVYS